MGQQVDMTRRGRAAARAAERRAYERSEDTVVRGLCEDGPLSHTELVRRVASRVGRSYEADVGNLVLVVTLDLEARGVVERLPGRPGVVQLSAMAPGWAA